MVGTGISEDIGSLIPAVTQRLSEVGTVISSSVSTNEVTETLASCFLGVFG